MCKVKHHEIFELRSVTYQSRCYLWITGVNILSFENVYLFHILQNIFTMLSSI